MDEHTIRRELSALLAGDQAHATFDKAIENFPVEKRGEHPYGLPHSAWQLLEHIRITQRDILDWCNNQHGSYRELKWPDDYWPKEAKPASETAWDKSVATVKHDRAELEKLAAHGDLTAPFPWDTKHTLARQIMLAADHAAYHVGEIVLLRRLLGCWD